MLWPAALHQKRENVEWESNFIPLQTIAQYSSIRVTFHRLQHHNRLMRQLFRDSFEEIVKAKIVARIIHCWTCASLPYIDHQIAEIMDNEDWIALRTMIEDM